MRQLTRVQCPVNVTSCLKWADCLGMRQLYHGRYSFAELQGFQAFRSKGKQGWVEDLFMEPRVPGLLQLQGSLEPTSWREGDGDLQEPLVPEGLKGLSVFAFPRAVRQLARTSCQNCFAKRILVL